MRIHAFAIAVLIGATGCQTLPQPTDSQPGYKGIEKIQILAKGME